MPRVHRPCRTGPLIPGEAVELRGDVRNIFFHRRIGRPVSRVAWQTLRTKLVASWGRRNQLLVSRLCTQCKEGAAEHAQNLPARVAYGRGSADQRPRPLPLQARKLASDGAAAATSRHGQALLNRQFRVEYSSGAFQRAHDLCLETHPGWGILNDVTSLALKLQASWIRWERGKVRAVLVNVVLIHTSDSQGVEDEVAPVVACKHIVAHARGFRSSHSREQDIKIGSRHPPFSNLKLSP
eukprot:scaffold5181_cov125-Isochrysis_galbana.AAC.13